MPLSLSETDALYYRHHAAPRTGATTFVFVNALTGSTEAWEAAVAPALRAQGFGTLSWNFRGQAHSPSHPALELTDRVITADLRALPVLVIIGLQDRVFLDREVVDRLAATLPDARREDWAEAGHLLPQEAPERLAARLARFGTEVSK